MLKRALLILIFMYTGQCIYAQAGRYIDTICHGRTERYKLKDKSAASYSWNIAGGTILSADDSSVEVRWNKDTGVHHIKVVGLNEMGCPGDTQEVLVLVVDKYVLSLNGDEEICVGDPVSLTAKGGYNYHWSNGSGDSSQVIYPQSDTVFWVFADYLGCSSDTVFHKVKVIPRPVAEFGIAKSNYATNDTVHLMFMGQNHTSMNWDFGDGEFLNGDQLAPEVLYYDTGRKLVRLVVANEAGCYDTSEKFIHISMEEYLHIPSSFTPNGDGINDVFRITGSGIKKMELTIFNRWGEIIAVTSDPGFTWDGLHKGEDAVEGAYAYSIHMIFFSGKRVNEKGNIYLMR